MPRPKKVVKAANDAPVVRGMDVFEMIHDSLQKESVKAQKEEAKGGTSLSVRSESIEDKTPVPYAISTGLPSFDLHLIRADNGEYGFPGARIIELLGPEASLKTTMAHTLVGQNLAKDGIAFWIQTEFEFDPEYAKTIYADQGVDVMNRLPVEVLDANTTGELFISMQKIISKLKTIALAGREHHPGKKAFEYMPRTIIVLDSLGALMATENHKRLEKDFETADKTGGHAKDIHDFFKFFIKDWNDLGVTFVYTNHYRDNLKANGPFSKQHVPAHNSATRYYATVRVDFRFFNDAALVKTEKQIEGATYDFGKKYQMSILKKRGRIVGDDTVIVPYYLNYGPDYLYSLMDATLITGLFKFNSRKKEYEMQIDVLTDEKWQLAMLPFVDEAGAPIIMSDAEFRDKLIDIPGLAESVKELCYEMGPQIAYNDPRKMSMKEIDEIGK